jgi:hypothetical protein
MIKSVMGISGLTRPTSFLAFAAGCVLPLRATNRPSSTRSTILVAGANRCAITAAEQNNTLANTQTESDRWGSIVVFLDLSSGTPPKAQKVAVPNKNAGTIPACCHFNYDSQFNATRLAVLFQDEGGLSSVRKMLESL